MIRSMLPSLRAVFDGLSMALTGVVTTAHAEPPAAHARDLAQEERNRQIVVDFYTGVFERHEVAKSSELLVDSYIQHNPGVPDGKQAFVSYFTELFKKNPAARSRIVRSATSGDLVYLHVHSTANDKDLGRAIVDIFRVKDGKIVEHWDVIQAVPDKARNNNTMF